MSATRRRTGRIPVENYLESELRSEIRHEFVDGEIFAMTGTSKRHTRVSMNLVQLLDPVLQGPCVFHGEGVKVWVKDARAFYYPDGIVTCDARDTDPYAVQAPTVIFEIVSQTTEAIDRREKRTHYTALASLQIYVILDPETRSATVYRRVRAFEPEELDPLAILDLPEIGQSLPLSAVFARL